MNRWSLPVFCRRSGGLKMPAAVAAAETWGSRDFGSIRPRTPADEGDDDPSAHAWRCVALFQITYLADCRRLPGVRIRRHSQRSTVGGTFDVTRISRLLLRAVGRARTCGQSFHRLCPGGSRWISQTAAPSAGLRLPARELQLRRRAGTGLLGPSQLRRELRSSMLGLWRRQLWRL